jgi:ATP-dependent Lhr-like helicase
MTTVVLTLRTRGVAVEPQGLALALSGATPQTTADLLRELSESELPAATELARLIPDQRIDKYDELIGEELLARSFAARQLDVPGARNVISRLAEQSALACLS